MLGIGGGGEGARILYTSEFRSFAVVSSSVKLTRLEQSRSVPRLEVSSFSCMNLISAMTQGLFELHNVPVNSYGHVGTLPPCYGTCTTNYNVMTSKKCFKY